MKYWLFITFAAASLLAGRARAQAITGFSVVQQKGQCSVVEGKKKTPIATGKEYAFGTTVMTGRNSWADLKFSEGNTFHLLARTRITIAQDIKHPKLKILRVDSGSVAIKLDKFPKDHSLQVETPTAVCGAVGTRFNVSFEYSADENAAPKLAGKRENSFSCDEGEVFVSSRFSVDAKPVVGGTLNVASLKAGSGLTATIHEGKENTYTDIAVNRGRLTFQYGGSKGNSFSMAPQEDGKPSRFVCALEKSGKDVTLAALEVKSGTVENTKKGRFFVPDTVTAITQADGPVIINKQEVRKPKEPTPIIGQYIAAAQDEGQLHSQLVEAKKVGDPIQIQALGVQVDAAAKKATTLRRSLVAVQTIRLLRQIRNRTRPPVRRP